MVEFKLTINKKQRTAYFNKTITDALGFDLHAQLTALSGVIYPKEAKKSDVIRSLEIISIGPVYSHTKTSISNASRILTPTPEDLTKVYFLRHFQKTPSNDSRGRTSSSHPRRRGQAGDTSNSSLN